jgi:hypothetical protein
VPVSFAAHFKHHLHQTLTLRRGFPTRRTPNVKSSYQESVHLSSNGLNGASTRASRSLAWCQSLLSLFGSWQLLHLHSFARRCLYHFMITDPSSFSHGASPSAVTFYQLTPLIASLSLSNMYP